MKLITAKNCGFCFGVQNAIKIALENAGSQTYTYGEIIHNERVVASLESKGIKAVKSLENITSGKIIIRSHGAPKSVYDEIEARHLTLIDATCPFVKNIHKIAKKYSQLDYHIVIVGTKQHPEVEGIMGWCENSTVIDENSELNFLEKLNKVCIIAQTTFNPEKYSNIIKKISKLPLKTVEFFDTICYTTSKRQFEAKQLAKICDVILVLGSKTSSNTTKLYEICSLECERVFHVEAVADIQINNFKLTDTIGIVAGASTPTELIMEVKGYMVMQFDEVLNQEFKDAVEGSLVNYKEGKRVKGTVISADENGVHINIGGKKDGLIPKEEVSLDGSFNPTDFVVGATVDAIIIAKQDPESGCVLLSKKRVDKIKEGDKVVETIRDGSVFEMVIDAATKGGLIGKIGTYTVFIPASQIREGFVKDLKVFVNKKMRLTALEIEDDESKHKIIASARKVIEAERKEREEIFWANVQPNVIVNGKVKRVTNFGAFVNIDGMDCLAHIVDLSWSHIKKVEDVLTIGENYDFLVLSVDREKGRVSLGYKQLQPHPFVACLEKHPIGSITKGKVVSIVPFGAFIEIEPEVEGLVHVSEAAHSFVKNINEIVKVGDVIDVMILNADEASRKITLSIKACIPEEQAVATENESVYTESPKSNDKYSAPKKSRNSKFDTNESDAGKEWNEDLKNNPFADLLKDIENSEKNDK